MRHGQQGRMRPCSGRHMCRPAWTSKKTCACLQGSVIPAHLLILDGGLLDLFQG